jgi:hypothetical protein
MRPRWSLALLLPLLLVLSSCFLFDGDISDLPPEQQTAIVALLDFVSDDGFFTFSVPADAVPAGTDISITAVPNADAPEPLRNLQGAGTVYKIEPSGMTLNEPARAALTLNMDDIDDFDGTGASAYALIGLSADEGERAPLDELSTDYSLGEAFLTTFGTTDAIPEFIGRTKGSLRAEMTEIGTLPVSEGAAVDFTLRNAARAEDGVSLKSAVGDALADGAVSITVEPDAEPKDLAAGESANGDFDILCADEPGTGVYTLVASATSLVEGGSPSGVPLRIVLDSTVECVEGEAATPTEPPDGELGFPEGLSVYLGNWGIPETLQTLVAFTEDAAGDHFYSDPSQEAGFTPESTDLSGVFAARVEFGEEEALTIEDLYPCGEVAENGVQTVCQFPTASLPPGEGLIFGGTLYGDFPTTPDRPCTLGALFDAPGAPWQPNAPFSDDLYSGAGTWYEVDMHPDGVVVLSVSRIGTAQEITPSTTQGRFFIDRTNRTFGGIIPASEVSGASGYRTTTFCGDTFFTPSESGGDVAPGARPTEFRQLPSDVIRLQQICGGTCVGRGPRERIL